MRERERKMREFRTNYYCSRSGDTISHIYRHDFNITLSESGNSNEYTFSFRPKPASLLHKLIVYYLFWGVEMFWLVSQT